MAEKKLPFEGRKNVADHGEELNDEVSASKAPLSEVGLDWVPLFRAPLYYSPRSFLSTLEDWGSYVRDLTKEFGREHHNFSPEVLIADDRSVTIAFSGLYLKLIPQTGFLSLEEKNTDVDIAGLTFEVFGRGRCDKFLSNLDKSKTQNTSLHFPIAMLRRFSVYSSQSKVLPWEAPLGIM